jgi:hypothetical protein
MPSRHRKADEGEHLRPVELGIPETEAAALASHLQQE